MIDDPPGLRNYWTADYLDELSDEAIDVFVEHSDRMPVPSACQSIMFPWGGRSRACRAGRHADGPARRRLGLAPVRAVGGRLRRRAPPRVGPRDLGRHEAGSPPVAST